MKLKAVMMMRPPRATSLGLRMSWWHPMLATSWVLRRLYDYKRWLELVSLFVFLPLVFAAFLFWCMHLQVVLTIVLVVLFPIAWIVGLVLLWLMFMLSPCHEVYTNGDAFIVLFTQRWKGRPSGTHLVWELSSYVARPGSKGAGGVLLDKVALTLLPAADAAAAVIYGKAAPGPRSDPGKLANHYVTTGLAHWGTRHVPGHWRHVIRIPR